MSRLTWAVEVVPQSAYVFGAGGESERNVNRLRFALEGGAASAVPHLRILRSSTFKADVLGESPSPFAYRVFNLCI